MALPASLRLGPVSLQVTDLDRSIAYYESVIGLRTLARESMSARLGAADGTVLVELTGGATRTVPRRGRLGLYHFAILLPNRQALGSFVAHLAAHEIHAGAADHLVSEALYLQDPDNLGIEVYADRPRAAWRVVNGQLAMDSLPLDFGSLIEEGRAHPWAGAPAGTTMGHVHLHVGDLPTAESIFGNALGMDVTVRGYPGALFLSAGGYHHHLGTNTWAGASAGPAQDGDARLLEWRMDVPADAIAPIVQRVTGAGYHAAMDGDSAIVRDPWGTVLRVRPA